MDEAEHDNPDETDDFGLDDIVDDVESLTDSYDLDRLSAELEADRTSNDNDESVGDVDLEGMEDVFDENGDAFSVETDLAILSMDMVDSGTDTADDLEFETLHDMDSTILSADIDEGDDDVDNEDDVDLFNDSTSDPVEELSLIHI